MDRLHLLGLAGPLLLAHLGFPAEELLVGLAVAATHAIPQRGKLAVVVVEVEVVHRVAGGAIHDGAVGHVLTVVNEDGPEVDKAEQEDVGQFLQREDERENVVWHTLRPAIQRVESVRRIRARHDPLVVRLVQGSVDSWMVQTPVDPVDEEIGEADEEGKLQDIIKGEGFLGDGVVEFGVASNFHHEKGRGEQSHWGHGAHGLLDLQRNLVFQELGVFVGCLVPNEDIGERRDHEVNEETKEPSTLHVRNRWELSVAKGGCAYQVIKKKLVNWR